MRHKISGRKLKRNSTHRKALLMNLSKSLIKHGRIKTTLAKAKELRTFIEPLITKSKTDELHKKRIVMKKLNDWELVIKLFEEIGPKFKDRNGGYTRILRLDKKRYGDASQMAFIEIIDSFQAEVDIEDESETKKEDKKKKKAKEEVETVETAEATTEETKEEETTTEEAKEEETTTEEAKEEEKKEEDK